MGHLTHLHENTQYSIWRRQMTDFLFFLSQNANVLPCFDHHYLKTFSNSIYNAKKIKLIVIKHIGF